MINETSYQAKPVILGLSTIDTPTLVNMHVRLSNKIFLLLPLKAKF